MYSLYIMMLFFFIFLFAEVMNRIDPDTGWRMVRKRKSTTLSRRARKAKRRTPTAWVIEDVQPSDDSAAPVSPSPTLRDQPHEPTASHREPVQPSSSFTIDEVLKLVSTIQENHKAKPQQFNSSHMNNVIPEFDPASKSQNIDTWLRKVNECTCIYGWDQKQTMHFALQKLIGLAKKWFEALPSVNYDWDEWQAKLRKAFPNEQNYGRLLEEMLARTTRYNEHLRDYFYDKLSLLNRCEIKGQKAVDCVIHGILDKSVRNGAQALNCK